MKPPDGRGRGKLVPLGNAGQYSVSKITARQITLNTDQQLSRFRVHLDNLSCTVGHNSTGPDQIEGAPRSGQQSASTPAQPAKRVF